MLLVKYIYVYAVSFLIITHVSVYYILDTDYYFFLYIFIIYFSNLYYLFIQITEPVREAIDIVDINKYFRIIRSGSVIFSRVRFSYI